MFTCPISFADLDGPSLSIAGEKPRYSPTALIQHLAYFSCASPMTRAVVSVDMLMLHSKDDALAIPLLHSIFAELQAGDLTAALHICDVAGIPMVLSFPRMHCPLGPEIG